MIVHILIPAAIILLVAGGAIIDKTDNRRPFGPKMCVNLCESLGHCEYPLYVTAQLDCYLGNVIGTSGVMLSTATHNRTYQYSRIILTRANNYITTNGERQTDRNENRSLTCTALPGTTRLETGNTQTNVFNTETNSGTPESEARSQVMDEGYEGQMGSILDQRRQQSVPTGDSMTIKDEGLNGNNGWSKVFERWSYGNTVLYLSVYTVRKTWDEALKVCQDERGSLVQLDSKQKQFAFNQMYKQTFSYTPAVKLWIGLRLRNKVWHWTDGSKIQYRNWASVMLTDRKKNGRCALTTIKPAYGINWYEENCEAGRFFVCEGKKP